MSHHRSDNKFAITHCICGGRRAISIENCRSYEDVLGIVNLLRDSGCATDAEMVASPYSVAARVTIEHYKCFLECDPELGTYVICESNDIESVDRVAEILRSILAGTEPE